MGMDMRRNKLTEASDWVVKVDADAVFLPERLVNMLQGYKVPEGGLYMENCEKVMFGFFGHLEVVSHDGFDTFLSRKAGHAAPIPDARRVFRVPCQHTEGMGVGRQALDTLSEMVEDMDAQSMLHAIRHFCV